MGTVTAANVREDHGARGDAAGRTDRRNVQHAIDTTGEAGGGRVFFPPGTYMIGGPNDRDGLWIPGSNIELVGSGAGCTTLKLGVGVNAFVIACVSGHR